VLFKTDSDKTSPFIDLGNDINLRFYLTTGRSDEFFNITKLDTTKRYVVGNKLYFTNNTGNAENDSSNPEELTHVIIDRSFAQLFTYSFSLTSAHTKTKFKMTDDKGNSVSVGKDADGNDLATTLNLSRDDSKQFQQQVDLRNKRSGIYTITIRNNADTTTLKEETILIDNEALQQGVLGLVDIKYDTATNHIYGATEYYQLKFNRKMAYWKYLVVNKTTTVALADLSIEDSPTGGGAPYANVDFNAEGPDIVKGFNAMVFKSDDEITSFEVPKPSIQLVLTTGVDDKVIIEHLPNPPLNTVEKENGGDIEKEIFVFI